MDAALIIARAVHFSAQLSLTGIFAFVCLVAAPAYARSGVAFRLPLVHKLSRLALWSLGIAVLSTLPWLVLVGRSMSGGTISPGVIGTVITQTQYGHVLVARLAGLALLLPCAIRVGQGRGRDRVGFALSIVVAAGIALQGHAGADLGWSAVLHLGSDALHLVVAAMWLGALVPLTLLFAETRREGMSAIAREAASRFSDLGLFCVAALLITGTVNAWFLVGSFPALVATAYGQLLVLKIVVFSAMVAIAAINRTILMPRGNTASIGRNALIEAALGFCVVAIVAALGTLAPAAHDPLGWPFAAVTTSPVPFAAVPIDVGAKLYAQQCAGCHGADAPQIAGRSDADLFALIGDGKGTMPGFAHQLDETERWSLIQFLKAQRAGIAAASMSAGVTVMAAPPAPDFSFAAPADAPGSLRAVLENGAVLLAFDDDPESPRLAALEAARPDLVGEGVFLLTLPGTHPARAAYALYERRVQRDAAAPAPHIEFLIDRDGFIRARWEPVDLPNRRDPAALAREIESLARLTLVPPPSASHFPKGD